MADKDFHPMKITGNKNEPVRPVSEYCQALYDWLELIRIRSLYEDAPENFKKIAEVIGPLTLSIQKSNYLLRRIYNGQPHRTEPCPIHQGRWSGYAGDESRICPEGCSNGIYDITGWLPEEKQLCPECGHIAQFHMSTISIATPGERLEKFWCSWQKCDCKKIWPWVL